MNGLAVAALGILVVGTLGLSGCCSSAVRSAKAANGDEIVVAGRTFSTGTRIVGWKEARGYDGYAGNPPLIRRKIAGSAATPQQSSDVGWTLPELRQVVDQVVLHYDACGLSKECFAILHQRGLSAHFLVDVDGTIYQTLDVQERALHATISNDRSIGIEIANIGAFPPDAAAPLGEWYRLEPDGRTTLTIPPRIEHPGILIPSFVGRPIRAERVEGEVQRKQLVQYDLTPEQYRALVKLTAALRRIFLKFEVSIRRMRTAHPSPTFCLRNSGEITAASLDTFIFRKINLIPDLRFSGRSSAPKSELNCKGERATGLN